MALDQDVKEGFEEIRKILKESAQNHQEHKEHFDREVRAILAILRDTATGDRERTMRLDKLEAELDEVREKVPA